MPRPKLSNVSVTQLLAELDRRKKRLADLISQRDDLSAQIAELESLQGPQPAPQAQAVQPGGRKARRGKRGTYARTANELILALLGGGKSRTTAEINAAWQAEGRPGRADTTITRLLRANKVVRTAIKGSRAGKYSMA